MITVASPTIKVDKNVLRDRDRIQNYILSKCKKIEEEFSSIDNISDFDCDSAAATLRAYRDVLSILHPLPTES